MNLCPKELYYAELYQGTTLVDKAEMNYKCEDIDKNACAEALPMKTIFWVLLVLVLIFIVIMIFKRRVIKPVVVALFLVASFLGTQAQAAEKTTQWNTTLGKFGYFWNFGGAHANATTTDPRRWAAALDTPNITVTYGATVTKETGEAIAEGSSLPAGTKIKLSFISHVPEHIAWFGTGYSGDSPYGEWRINSAPPTVGCSPKDFVTRSFAKIRVPFGGNRTYTYNTFIPLVVSPPVKTITNLQNLTCGDLVGDTMLCTVSGAGPIAPTFNFGNTSGKFYYRWQEYGKTGCSGNNVPLRSVTGFNYSYTQTYTDAGVARVGGGQEDTGSNYVTGTAPSAYVLAVPEKSIAFNFVGEDEPNTPPSDPVITGPIEGVIGQSYNFSFVSTDPENHQVKYGVNWSGTGTDLQLLPGTGLVNDETPQSASKSWNSVGTYTFRAKAEDSKGASSGWSTHEIRIGEAPPPGGPACGTATSFATWPENNTGLCAVGDAGDLHFNALANQYNWSCSIEHVDEVSCTADRLPVRPSTPLLSAQGVCGSSEVGRNRVELAFRSTQGSIPATFTVTRSTATNGTYTELLTPVNATVTTSGELTGGFTDATAQPGATYYYKVKATNNAGESGWSVATIAATPATCEEVVGICGEAITEVMMSSPQSTAGLCSVGNSSAVTLNSQRTAYTWTCTGPDGYESCEAQKALSNEAECGEAIYETYGTPPPADAPNLCNPGRSSTPGTDPEDADKYKWICTSLNGQNVKTCRANKPEWVDPICEMNPEECNDGEVGSPNPFCGYQGTGGVMEGTPDLSTPGLCDSNSQASNLSSYGNGGYTWRCTVPSNGRWTSCSAGEDVVYIPPPVVPPVIAEGAVLLNDLKTYPALVNSGKACAVDVGLASGLYRVVDANTRCTLEFPDGTDNPTFVPQDGHDKRQQDHVFVESAFKITCHEIGADGLVIPGSEQSETALCKINPNQVETTFLRRLFVGFKDMGASALNAFAKFFNLK